MATSAGAPPQDGDCLQMFIVDAFTSVAFEGNPASVCLDSTEKGLPAELMQKIAAEMNHSETAFLRCKSDSFQSGNHFGLRWFTPTTEYPLCGHATVASATVLFRCLGNQNTELIFDTLSGPLVARRQGDTINLDMPLNPPQQQDHKELEELLRLISVGYKVKDLQYSPTTKNLLVRFEDAMSRQEFEAFRPKVEGFKAAHNLGKVTGVIVTLKGGADKGCVDRQGEPYDFVSRCFAPWIGVPEDPVTGSAHTILAPYWSAQLGKTKLYARQCSARGGDVRMAVHTNGRVDVAGPATVVLQGKITV